MKRYQLSKENYIIEKKFRIERLELDNIISLEYFKPDIQLLINYFNEEYKWDGMFDIIDVENRIYNGHIIFILYYGENPIGYVWFKKLSNKTSFGYNLYVTKKVDRPKNSARWFYNKVSDIILKEFEIIEVEIEDWNKVVFDLVESIGYKLM